MKIMDFDLEYFILTSGHCVIVPELLGIQIYANFRKVALAALPLNIK